MAEPTHAIELRGVSKRFGAETVVDRLDLSIADGELLMLVGGSGSGKTTTLRMINRLIEPTSGTVAIFGEDVRDKPAHLLRRSIGYVFQRVGLFPHMSVAENIAVPLTLDGGPVDPSAIEARVGELLDLVELPRSLADRAPAALSGGQAQRVGVARALATKPRVVLFDEPFGALDPVTRDRMQRSLQELRRSLGLSGVFVTHDMSEALLLGDRIAVLREGKLLQVGAPAELVRSPADDYVAELVETPLRQARACERLAGRDA